MPTNLMQHHPERLEYCEEKLNLGQSMVCGFVVVYAFPKEIYLLLGAAFTVLFIKLSDHILTIGSNPVESVKLPKGNYINRNKDTLHCLKQCYLYGGARFSLVSW